MVIIMIFLIVMMITTQLMEAATMMKVMQAFHGDDSAQNKSGKEKVHVVTTFTLTLIMHS